MSTPIDGPPMDGTIDATSPATGGSSWPQRMVAAAAGLGMFLAALDIALSEEHHLGGLAGSGLAMAEQEAKALIQAFQDVLRLGATISLVGAGVLLLGRQRRVL